MAIAFRASSTNASSNGGAPSLTMPSGTATDDLVIVCFSWGSTADYPEQYQAIASQGWTPLGHLTSSDAQDGNLAVFAKFMGSTPDSSVTLTGDNNTANSGAAIAMAFSGVDKTRPFDALPTTATGINTANADPASITPSGAAGVWTVICAAAGHAGGSTLTYTFPSGYTTNAVSLSGNDTNDCIAGMGYNSSPSNPENPGALTISTDSVNDAWCAMTIALRPSENAGIFVVGTVAGSATNGDDVTLTLPTCLENDLVVVAGNIPRQSDIDVTMTTSGYTEVADIAETGDSNDVNLGVFYKKMGASPDTTAVFNGGNDASDGVSAVAVVLRGVDTTTPMDVTATTATGVNSVDPNPPSIDYSDTNALILVAMGTGHALGATHGHTMPQYYMGVTACGNDTRDSAVSLAWLGKHLASDPENPTQGYEVRDQGNGSAGTVQVTNSWAAVTMALRKAAAAAGFMSIIVVGN